MVSVVFTVAGISAWVCPKAFSPWICEVITVVESILTQQTEAEEVTLGVLDSISLFNFMLCLSWFLEHGSLKKP